MICRASLSRKDWLECGMEVWSRIIPETYTKNDFWLFESCGNRADFTRPISLARFISNFKNFSAQCVARAAVTVKAREELLSIIPELTGHSLRCAMPSELGHLGATPEHIMLQGHWRDSTMVQKYLRNRGAVTTANIDSLVKEVRRQWRDQEGARGEVMSESVSEEEEKAEEIVDAGNHGRTLQEDEDLTELPEGDDGDGGDCGSGDDDFCFDVNKYSKQGGHHIHSECEVSQQNTADRISEPPEVEYWASKCLLDRMLLGKAVWHLVHAGSSRSLCNLVDLSKCENLGVDRPEFGRVCTKCEARSSRPGEMQEPPCGQA